MFMTSSSSADKLTLIEEFSIYTFLNTYTSAMRARHRNKKSKSASKHRKQTLKDRNGKVTG